MKKEKEKSNIIKLKRKRPKRTKMLVAFLAAAAVLVVLLVLLLRSPVGEKRVFAGRGAYYEKGADGKIYYHDDGNDPSVNLMITPLLGAGDELLGDAE